MRRRLFTIAAAVSLVLCLAAAALWVRGVGRAEGWYFEPSAVSVLKVPEDSLQDKLPSRWYTQWQVTWGDSGDLSVNRQFKPVERQPRIGFRTFVMPTRRWNPLPRNNRVADPRIASTAMLGGRVISVAYRTKPSTAWSHLGIGYGSHAQEFLKYPNFDHYVAASGLWAVSVPILYLFVLFAILPGIWAIRLYRTRWRWPEGHCIGCGYNLAGNTSGVCPECGMPVAVKAGAKR